MRSALALLLLLLSPAGANGLDGLEVCPAPQDELLSGESYLRALSLDLRGYVPTVEEYDTWVVDGEVDEAVIETWLDTSDFADQVVRLHRDLLWPNVSDIRLLSNRQRLDYDDGVYYRYLVAPNYRGGPVSCGENEAEYDEDGEIIVYEDEDGYLREGWVEVEPYWAPGETVKVCAFEAQTEEVSPWGTECNTYDSRYDPYCGCGPNLQWCDTFSLGHVQDNGVQAPVHWSIARDVEKRIEAIIEQDRSYLDLFEGDTMMVNGPLVHFLKNNLETPAHIRFNEVPVDPELLPDLDFDDTGTWVEVELGEEQAGVLTSLQYLMKFQTRRGRVNRFFNAFLCQPFEPPDGGLGSLDDPDASLDLTQRDGCKYCHAIIEPAGAHWARWGEYGAGYLDPESFPTFSEDCEWCALSGESCSPECTLYYVTDPLSSEEDPFLGYLLSYEFLEERHYDNAIAGPSLLARQGVLDGRLPRCSAETAVEWLLDREVESHDEAWIEELAMGFNGSGFQYKDLIQDIVTSDAYRRLQ